jgi:NADPH:quinone reductase
MRAAHPVASGMRAIIHTENGDASVLRLVDRAVPEPGMGEVRIKIAVSGVNPTDWKNRSGFTGDSAGVETVPNQDGAGTVDAVGAGVDSVAVGDRVWVTLAAYQRPANGTAQEYTIEPVERVFPLPHGASFELGASIGVPAVTAFRALTVAEDGPSRLHPGALDERVVLVAGGAGAVGNAAIQLARWAGATVIATVSGSSKGALARSAGAHHVINYTDADAASQIRSLTPEGVDLVVEVAVGTNAELDLAVLKVRGTIAVYANNGDKPFSVDIRRNMSLNARYQYVLLYTLGGDTLANAAEDVNAAITAGAFGVGSEVGLPVHRFALEDTPDAHRKVESGAVGKVLVTVDPEPAAE